MKIINNVPVGYQERFEGPIAFILLHKLIDSKIYRDFYLDNHRKFQSIILDNSCFELGKSLDGGLLMKWANKLRFAHPKTHIEIIVPDHYRSRDKTIELMEDFFEEHYDKNFGYMAVPQGTSRNELHRCLIEILNEPKIDCIGLNKLWSKKDIERIVPVIVNTGVSVHRLGVNKLSDWVLNCSNLIRTADSRILAKIVTGTDKSIWNEKLTIMQEDILDRLIKEVNEW